MSRRPIHTEVMGLATLLAQECHPQVAQQHAAALARYARLTSACEALESFIGVRPRDDDDAFAVLVLRRAEIADQLARANLQAHMQEAPAGLYLAIAYFSRCTDKQPIWLLNRTEQQITYLCRRMYAYASADDGIDEYQGSGNAFAAGLAASCVIEPGGRLQIDEYSLNFDGDFVSSHRIVLLIEGVRSEWFCTISKLGGYLWDAKRHGLHALESVSAL